MRVPRERVLCPGPRPPMPGWCVHEVAILGGGPADKCWALSWDVPDHAAASVTRSDLARLTAES